MSELLSTKLKYIKKADENDAVASDELGQKVLGDLQQHLLGDAICRHARSGAHLGACGSASRAHKKKLLSQEVVLNHFFNIAFDIADDTTVSELLCGPLGINDTGPFDSYNQGFGHERFGWPEQANVTQPDGFFFSSNSLIAVELKLESLTRVDQIAKYLAVMHLEEKHSGKRGNLGLLFIVPEKVRERIFSKIGMKGATIDSDFIARLKEVKFPLRLKTPAEELEGIAKRVRLASVSWTWLRDRLKQIESELDGRNRGEQTLLRLLRGLRTQIEKHGKTGIPRPSDRSS